MNLVYHSSDWRQAFVAFESKSDELHRPQKRKQAAEATCDAILVFWLLGVRHEDFGFDPVEAEPAELVVAVAVADEDGAFGHGLDRAENCTQVAVGLAVGEGYEEGGGTGGLLDFLLVAHASSIYPHPAGCQPFVAFESKADELHPPSN